MLPKGSAGNSGALLRSHLFLNHGLTSRFLCFLRVFCLKSGWPPPNTPLPRVAGTWCVWSSALFHVVTCSRGGGVALWLATVKNPDSIFSLFFLRSSNRNNSLQDLWRQIIRHPLWRDNVWGLQGKKLNNPVIACVVKKKREKPTNETFWKITEKFLSDYCLSKQEKCITVLTGLTEFTLQSVNSHSQAEMLLKSSQLQYNNNIIPVSCLSLSSAALF